MIYLYVGMVVAASCPEATHARFIQRIHYLLAGCNWLSRCSIMLSLFFFFFSGYISLNLVQLILLWVLTLACGVHLIRYQLFNRNNSRLFCKFAFWIESRLLSADLTGVFAYHLAVLDDVLIFVVRHFDS